MYRIRRLNLAAVNFTPYFGLSRTVRSDILGHMTGISPEPPRNDLGIIQILSAFKGRFLGPNTR